MLNNMRISNVFSTKSKSVPGTYWVFGDQVYVSRDLQDIDDNVFYEIEKYIRRSARQNKISIKEAFNNWRQIDMRGDTLSEFPEDGRWGLSPAMVFNMLFKAGGGYTKGTDFEIQCP